MCSTKQSKDIYLKRNFVHSLEVSHIDMILKTVFNFKVTGKVRRGFNPFNSGCCGNWEKVFCSPIQPQ